jgi:hypothetical protein
MTSPQFKGGHPGTVMGAAAIGVALWRHLMVYNPKNPDWYVLPIVICELILSPFLLGSTAIVSFYRQATHVSGNTSTFIYPGTTRGRWTQSNSTITLTSGYVEFNLF